jgi:hypothetical protein
MDMDSNLLSDRIVHGTTLRDERLTPLTRLTLTHVPGRSQGLPENWRDYFRDRLAKATREAM